MFQSIRSVIPLCLILVQLAIGRVCSSQDIFVCIGVELELNGQSLTDGIDDYSQGPGDSLRIDKLRFYIAHVQLIQEGRVIGKSVVEYQLVDMEDPTSLKINCSTSTTRFDHIRFQLGIDSLTNVSGAMGGDLDPTMGMYWTWQSGYINFKLEGSSPACPARNHEFQFHLGGYMPPFNCMQEIDLAIADASHDPVVVLDIGKLVDTHSLQTNHHVMHPGVDAVNISQRVAQLFEIR